MEHVAALCEAKKRCAKSGGAQDYGECGNNVKVNCCNCGGNTEQHLVDARYIKRLERPNGIKSLITSLMQRLHGRLVELLGRMMGYRVTPGISGPTVGNVVYVGPDTDLRPVQKFCSHKCVVSKGHLNS